MDRAYVYWADAAGATRLVWYSYTTGGTLTPFGTAADNCSNATPAQTVAGMIQVDTTPPSTNPYLNVQDSAVLTFSTGIGTLVGVIVPAFKEALYLGDNQTVDLAQPLVAALIAAAIALPIVDSAGNPVLTYVGGLRQKRGF